MKLIVILIVIGILFGASMLLFQQFFYSIFVGCYHTLIRIASIFKKKASLWVKGRKDLFEDLKLHFEDNNKKTVWVHCASLGEFEQGRTVMESLKKQHPEIKILLTFYSPSGYEIQKNYQYADHVCYFPADTAKNAEKFISIVKPDIALFVKYEFWIHHINVLHNKQIPLFLISGIFRKNQLFFKWYAPIFRTALKKYTRIFVQNETSLKLLQSIKINTAEICFDTRFDRVNTIAENRKTLPEIATFVKDHNVIIAGSTWPKDEKLLAKAFYRSLVFINFKIIIVPHNIEEKYMRKTKKMYKKFSLIYSELNKATEADLIGKRVLIIDNIGMLSSLYQYGDINYIGGGFNKGIHNCLEAAVYGKPILFGPKFKKFNEAVELTKRNAAFDIRDYNELLNRINLMNQFQFIYKGASIDAEDYVQSHLGGTDKIVKETLEQLGIGNWELNSQKKLIIDN